MTITTQDTYLTERIAEQERYLASLEALYANLRDGTAEWWDFNPDYTCPNRQEAAIDECGTALDDARAELEKLRAQAAHGNAGAGETR